MNLAHRPVDIFQVFGETPQVLAGVLQDGVNLAVWRRRLPPQLEDFAALVISLGQPLADQRVIDVDEEQKPVLADLLREAADLHGYEAFVADVTWLVAAYTWQFVALFKTLKLIFTHLEYRPSVLHVDKADHWEATRR